MKQGDETVTEDVGGPGIEKEALRCAGREEGSPAFPNAVYLAAILADVWPGLLRGSRNVTAAVNRIYNSERIGDSNERIPYT
jgi:hypothetical protein